MTTDNGFLVMFIYPVLAGILGIGIFILLKGASMAVRSIFE